MEIKPVIQEQVIPNPDPVPVKSRYDAALSSISSAEKSCCNLLLCPFYWIYDEILEPLYDWIIEVIYEPPLYKPIADFIYQGSAPSQKGLDQLKSESFVYIISLEEYLVENPNEDSVIRFLQIFLDAKKSKEKIFIYSNENGKMEFCIQLILVFLEDKTTSNDFINHLEISKIKDTLFDRLPPEYYAID